MHCSHHPLICYHKASAFMFQILPFWHLDGSHVGPRMRRCLPATDYARTWGEEAYFSFTDAQNINSRKITSEMLHQKTQVKQHKRTLWNEGDNKNSSSHEHLWHHDVALTDTERACVLFLKAFIWNKGSQYYAKHKGESDHPPILCFLEWKTGKHKTCSWGRYFVAWLLFFCHCFCLEFLCVTFPDTVLILLSWSLNEDEQSM